MTWFEYPWPQNFTLNDTRAMLVPNADDAQWEQLSRIFTSTLLIYLILSELCVSRLPLSTDDQHVCIIIQERSLLS